MHITILSIIGCHSYRQVRQQTLSHQHLERTRPTLALLSRGTEPMSLQNPYGYRRSCNVCLQRDLRPTKGVERCLKQCIASDLNGLPRQLTRSACHELGSTEDYTSVLNPAPSYQLQSAGKGSERSSSTQTARTFTRFYDVQRVLGCQHVKNSRPSKSRPC